MFEYKPRLVPSGRKKNSIDDSIMPLINIVFLLLIFFMVAGRLSQGQSQKIELPTSHSNKAWQPSGVVIELSAQAQVFLNGELRELDQLQNELTPDQAVSLKIDRKLVAADLDRLLGALHRIGISKIRVAATKPGEVN